jgi:hypothetical protein
MNPFCHLFVLKLSSSGHEWLWTARDWMYEICVRHTTSCYIDGRDEGISDYFETWKGLKAVQRVFDILSGDSSVRAEELDSLKGRGK